MADFAKLLERMKQPKEPDPPVPSLVIGITGHRPDKLASKEGGTDGYEFANPLRVEIRKRIESETLDLIQNAKKDRMNADYVHRLLKRVTWNGTPVTGGTLCVSGGALGIDQDACGVWHRMGVPYLVVIPFWGQDSRWTQEAKIRYRLVCQHAAGYVVVSKERPETTEQAGAMLKKRNDFLCQLSNELIAVYDGSQGGTRHCLYCWDWYMHSPFRRIDPREVRAELLLKGDRS